MIFSTGEDLKKNTSRLNTRTIASNASLDGHTRHTTHGCGFFLAHVDGTGAQLRNRAPTWRPEGIVDKNTLDLGVKLACMEVSELLEHTTGLGRCEGSREGSSYSNNTRYRYKHRRPPPSPGSVSFRMACTSRGLLARTQA